MFGCGESQAPPHFPDQKDSTIVPNPADTIPAQKPLGLFIGVNGSADLDQFIGKAYHPAHIFTHGRIFHNLGVDYDHKYPKDYTPVECLSDCSNISCQPWQGSFASNKWRYCSAKDVFSELTVSPEVVFLDNQFKPFPFKHFTPGEWGADIEQKAYDWAKVFFVSLHGIVDILELGNEPWGYDVKTWTAIQTGIHRAWKEYAKGQIHPIKLSTAALPVGEASQFWTHGLGAFTPVELRRDLDYISFHSYPARGGKWDIKKLELVKADIDAVMSWRDQYMPHAKVRLTETGFPTNLPFLEEDQLAYIQGVADYADQKGVDGIFIYQLLDHHHEAVYGHTGLITEDGKLKKAYTWHEDRNKARLN